MIQIAVADPLVSASLFRPDQLPAEAAPKHRNRTLPAVKTRRQFADQMIKELTTHAYMEETLFYPAARKAAPDAAVVPAVASQFPAGQGGKSASMTWRATSVSRWLAVRACSLWRGAANGERVNPAGEGPPMPAGRDGDVEAFTLMTGLADEIDAGMAEAVKGVMNQPVLRHAPPTTQSRRRSSSALHARYRGSDTLTMGVPSTAMNEPAGTTARCISLAP